MSRLGYAALWLAGIVAAVIVLTVSWAGWVAERLDLRSWWRVGVVVLVVLVLVLVLATRGAWAHDPYTGWSQPGTGVGCCNNRDCRPARAYLGNDGLHYVWLAGRWRPVPAMRVLRRPSPDLSAHVCANDETLEIICFVAGPGGS